MDGLWYFTADFFEAIFPFIKAIGRFGNAFFAISSLVAFRLLGLSEDNMHGNWVPTWIGNILFLSGISVLTATKKKETESMIFLISLGLFLISLSVLNFSLACIAGIAFAPMAFLY